MFKVTKEEAEYIRKHAKHARITTTGKKKNKRQKKRYVDESRETLYLLNRYRKKLNITKHEDNGK